MASTFACDDISNSTRDGTSPATACYIITATIAAPALIGMGLTPLAAHFFVFYFGTLSTVIPPVALTSYTAAGLAGANPTQVTFTGFKLASAGLVIPYIFVYDNSLLLVNVQFYSLVLTIVSGLIGIVFLSYSNENFIFKPIGVVKKILLFAAAICLVSPGLKTDVIGMVLGGIIVLNEFIAKSKHAKENIKT